MTDFGVQRSIPTCREDELTQYSVPVRCIGATRVRRARSIRPVGDSRHELLNPSLRHTEVFLQFIVDELVAGIDGTCQRHLRLLVFEFWPVQERHPRSCRVSGSDGHSATCAGRRCSHVRGLKFGRGGARPEVSGDLGSACVDSSALHAEVQADRENERRRHTVEHERRVAPLLHRINGRLVEELHRPQHAD